MRQTLKCCACGAALTKPVTILSTKDPAVGDPKHVAGKPISQPGTAYKSWKPQEWAIEGERPALDFTPQFWINPADVAAGVQATNKRDRIGGCCGLAGSNGLNQTCRCGTEIGTLRTDCWTDHVFVPEPTATEWQEIEDVDT